MENVLLDVERINARPLFPVNDLVISLFKECTPKILVYTDGLNYGTGDFGLSDFINTLKNTSIHGMLPIVETAHAGGTAADYSNFTFTSSTLSKNKYDVLFLFGVSSGGTLPAPEISIIEQFMNDGGGVFATGDHENLGKRCCGEIMRIKELRRWAGPSAGGTDRISTNDPGTDNTFQFEDQSDAIAQKIYPAYTGTTSSSSPHYLLQHPSKKIIEVLPDHPHESECTLPASLADVSVWPKDSSGNDVEPEVVALSVSYGGGFTGKEPISTPRAFNAIVAYDGHRAGVGRITTDATWHHFININMIASTDGPGLVANADAYDRVSTYFGNIAKWLMPEKTRRCLRWPLILTIKELYPVAEFMHNLSDKPELPKLMELGRETRFTLSRFMTPGEQNELFDDLFDLHSKELSKAMLLLGKSPETHYDVLAQQTAPVQLLQDTAAGAIMYTVSRAFSGGIDTETALKSSGGVKGLEQQAKKSVKSALSSLAKSLIESRSQFDNILNQCQ